MEIAAWGAAKAEIDAIGIERSKGAELLGHDQRRVIRQHDAAAANADAAGRGGDVADENRRGGTGQPLDGGVLGEPVAAVSPLLSEFCQRDGAPDSGAGGFASSHADQVENGNGKSHGN